MLVSTLDAEAKIFIRDLGSERVWRTEVKRSGEADCLPPSPCFSSASFHFVMDLWSKTVLGINAHVALILFSLYGAVKAGE